MGVKGVNVSSLDGNFEKTFYCILHLYFNFNLKTRNVSVKFTGVLKDTENLPPDVKKV